MLAALGIMLLITSAILTFALHSAVDGVDVLAIGWILMAGGGLALLISTIDHAGWRST